jgi:hypothetical protein
MNYIILGIATFTVLLSLINYLKNKALIQMTEVIISDIIASNKVNLPRQIAELVSAKIESNIDFSTIKDIAKIQLLELLAKEVRNEFKFDKMLEELQKEYEGENAYRRSENKQEAGESNSKDF